MKMKKSAICMTLCIMAVSIGQSAYAADRATSSNAPEIDRPTEESESGTIGNTENVIEEIKDSDIIDAMLNITVPMDFSFLIDPINLTGDGQIQSKDYIFENNGQTDITVTFSEISYSFPNSTDFRSLSSLEMLDTYSTTKDLYLYLEHHPEDPTASPSDYKSKETSGSGSAQIILGTTPQADSYSFVLSADPNAANHTALFRLHGAVNEFPEIPWQDQDVQICVVYRCTPIVDILEEDTHVDGLLSENIPDKEILPTKEPQTETTADTKPDAETTSEIKPDTETTAEIKPDTETTAEIKSDTKSESGEIHPEIGKGSK